MWGAFDGVDLAGVIAVRPGWIDQLYVRPDRQGRSFGTALLAAAKQGATELSLWTFEANAPARSFYERRGFVAVETTDGSRNEEREPDVRYLWRAEERLTEPMWACGVGGHEQTSRER